MSHLHITIINNPHPNSSFLFNTTSTYITSTSIHIHIYPQPTSSSSSAGSSDRIFSLSSRVLWYGGWERGLEDRLFFFECGQNLRVHFLIAFFIFFLSSISSSSWRHLFHRHLILIILSILQPLRWLLSTRDKNNKLRGSWTLYLHERLLRLHPPIAVL